MTVVDRAKVFSALSDPVRLTLLDELRTKGHACGTELSQTLGISLSLVCHHTKVLTEAGLVNKAKEGTTARYSLNGEALNQCLKTLE